VKLIDFGFAAKVQKEHPFTDKLGSLGYLAPEIFTEVSYDSKVDIWAAGIVLYNMLSGKQPFNSASSEKDLISEITNKSISFEDKVWEIVSKECKDLLVQLLIKKPFERITAFQARNHKWIHRLVMNETNPTVKMNFQPKPEKIQEMLGNLLKQNEIKKDITVFLVKEYDNSNIDQVVQALTLKASNSRVKDSLSKFHLPLSDILDNIKSNSMNEVFKKKLDIIINKNIATLQRTKANFIELFKTLKKVKEIIQKESLLAIFKTENKQSLSLSQIEQLYVKNNRKFNKDKVQELLKMNLIHSQDKITFEDFVCIWEQDGLPQ